MSEGAGTWHDAGLMAIFTAMADGYERCAEPWQRRALRQYVRLLRLTLVETCWGWLICMMILGRGFCTDSQGNRCTCSLGVVKGVSVRGRFGIGHSQCSHLSGASVPGRLPLGGNEDEKRAPRSHRSHQGGGADAGCCQLRCCESPPCCRPPGPEVRADGPWRSRGSCHHHSQARTSTSRTRLQIRQPGE